MSNPWVVVAITIALIVLSAFFVAAEFALLAAKRHRLQDLAEHSRGARAALRSHRELTILLAGCQLGITASALGLGAITKPAVKYALGPVFEDWGAPSWLASAAAFILALLVVTFLHLVIGEMAPKSWAIAHPESAAVALAVPMRGFMWLTRPLLTALNSMANWCLRKVGVQPQDSVAEGQTAEDLRQLVEHSATVGSLDELQSTRLGSALEIQDLTVADLVRPGRGVTSVEADASVAELREVARQTGHLRILVTRKGTLEGVVHVRETLGLNDADGFNDLTRPVFVLDAAEPVYSALARMRETRNHLAVVEVKSGVGVVTLADVLARLLVRTDTV